MGRAPVGREQVRECCVGEEGGGAGHHAARVAGGGGECAIGVDEAQLLDPGVC